MCHWKVLRINKYPRNYYFFDCYRSQITSHEFEKISSFIFFVSFLNPLFLNLDGTQKPCSWNFLFLPLAFFLINQIFKHDEFTPKTLSTLPVNWDTIGNFFYSSPLCLTKHRLRNLCKQKIVWQPGQVNTSNVKFHSPQTKKKAIKNQ